VSADHSEEPDRPGSSDEAAASPTANFLAALNVRRNAVLGVLSGLVLAVAVYAYFVAIPVLVPAVPARDRSPLLYLLLAFVVAVTTAMLVATALTGVSAVRLSRELE
jgi:hypothetical protein